MLNYGEWDEENHESDILLKILDELLAFTRSRFPKSRTFREGKKLKA